jgi:hypothetical protein
MVWLLEESLGSVGVFWYWLGLLLSGLEPARNLVIWALLARWQLKVVISLESTLLVVPNLLYRQ